MWNKFMKKVNIAKMKIYGRGSRRSGGKAEVAQENKLLLLTIEKGNRDLEHCLLYTSPSPRDRQKSRMPSSA